MKLERKASVFKANVRRIKIEKILKMIQRTFCGNDERGVKEEEEKSQVHFRKKNIHGATFTITVFSGF